MKQKKRLDTLLTELHPSLTRSYLQSLIMQGRVKVEGKVITKAGTPLLLEDTIEIEWPVVSYASRAGLKLEKALKHFGIDVTDLVCLDAGLSTGGFADCLLQHGAKRIYGVDVGYGQLHEKLRTDPRVIAIERTNLRYLEELPIVGDESTPAKQVDIVTLDLSFISVLKVLETVKKFLKPTGTLIILIKPQFEARQEQVGKGGIIRDPTVHQETIKRVIEGVQQVGFSFSGVTESPIEGTDGNKEFLALFYHQS